MRKLIRGEFTKIFKKPGIYLITILLVIILAVTGFIYSPQPSTAMQVRYANKTTVGQITDYFNNSNGANTKTKIEEDYIEATQNLINTYSTEHNEKEILKQKINQICTNFDNYKQEYQSNGDTTLSNNLKINLQSSINTFKVYLSSITSAAVAPTILIKVNEKNAISLLLNQATTILNTVSSTEPNQYIILNLDGIELNKKLINFEQTTINFKPSNEILSQLQQKLDNIKPSNSDSILNTIFQSIQNYNSSEITSSSSLFDTNNIYNLITEYKYTAKVINDLAVNQINQSALSVVNASTIKDYINFSEYNSYIVNDIISKNLYMFEKGTNQYQYGTTFGFATTSSSKTSMFDYSYFALQICSLLIFIYIIALGANIIAGEFNGGTMKMLAIRPYKRNKIITAKILTCLLVGIILLLIAYSSTLIVGVIGYSYSITPILLTFNSTYTFVVSPIGLSLIYLACKIIELSIYVIIATTISTISKNNIASISIAFIIFFASFIVTPFATSSIFNIVPFFNFNLYKFFVAMPIENQSITEMLFNPTIITNANFIISSIINVVLLLTLIIINSQVFNKRDIK